MLSDFRFLFSQAEKHPVSWTVIGFTIQKIKHQSNAHTLTDNTKGAALNIIGLLHATNKIVSPKFMLTPGLGRDVYPKLLEMVYSLGKI